MRNWPTPPGGIRAITFDLDYTLWDLGHVLPRAEQRQYDYLVANYPRVCERYSLEDFTALRLQLAEQRADLRHNVTELRREVLRTTALACGYDDSLVDPAFQVFIDARHEVEPFEDALPLLESLKGRYVLGVITNGNADVRRLGLGGYFDFAVSPMDVGAAKPDRVIFEAACNRAGVQPEQVVHIGDEPQSDVIGAARYGMVPVWLRRPGLAWGWPEGLERCEHIELDSLSAFGELLARWDA